MRRITTAFVGQGYFKKATIEAQVTVGPETAARLGVPVGTVIDYGTIAYWHRNPLKRWAWRLKQCLWGKRGKRWPIS